MSFRWRAATVAGLAAMLVLSACGGSGKPESTGGGGPSSSADTDQLVVFAKCLREHGVQVPDPKPGQSLGQWIQGMDGARLRQTGGLQACQDKLPPGIRAQAGSPQRQDSKLKYAQCMRANGVDMPDPKNGQIDFGNVDRNSPRFKQASQKCRTYLTGQAGR